MKKCWKVSENWRKVLKKKVENHRKLDTKLLKMGNEKWRKWIENDEKWLRNGWKVTQITKKVIEDHQKFCENRIKIDKKKCKKLIKVHEKMLKIYLNHRKLYISLIKCANDQLQIKIKWWNIGENWPKLWNLH